MELTSESNALYSDVFDMVKSMVSQEENTFHSIKTSK